MKSTSSRNRSIVSRWWYDRSGYQFVPGLIPEGSTVETSIEANQRVVCYISDDVDYAYDDLKRSDWIVSRSPVDVFHHVWNGVIYDPMLERRLFADFAQLEPTVDAILGFADKFGLLTECPEVVRLEHNGLQYAAEELGFWLGHLFQMQTMMRISHLLKDPSAEATVKLREMITPSFHEVYFSDAFRDELLEKMKKGMWFPGSTLNSCSVVPLSPPQRTEAVEKWIEQALSWIPDPMYLEVPKEERPRSQQLDPDDRFYYRLFLQRMVNMTLAETTVPMIQLKPGSQIQLRPINLLGAMYLQLALELIGQSPDAIKCHHCGKWFVPDHGRQIYCDDRCKFKAYRKRKQTGEKTK